MSKKKKHAAAPRHMTQPRDLDRWLERAARQLVVGDYNGAIAIAQRVLRVPIASKEQRAEAYDRLGAAYMMLQQFSQAYAVVSAALELLPDDPMIWYNHGMTARYTMRIGRSLRDFERAAELDAEGMLAEKTAEAITLARQFVADALTLRGPHFTLDQLITQEDLFQQAMQLMEQHRWEEAEQAFRQVIALADVLPQPWGNLGVCLMMQRQFDPAEDALRRALAIDPDYTIARQNLVGLPEIRKTGKLPMMRVSNPLEDQDIKRSIQFVLRDDEE